MKLILTICPKAKDAAYCTVSVRDENNAVVTETTFPVLLTDTEKYIIFPSTYEDIRYFMNGFLCACGFDKKEELNRIGAFMKAHVGKAVRVEYGTKSTSLAKNHFYIVAL